MRNPLNCMAALYIGSKGSLIRKKISGFTLVELMITVIVTGVILAVAVPSFNSLIRNNRIVTLTNEVVSALRLARSEAIKRTETIILCSTTDGATCAGSTNWQSGWLMLDADNNILRRKDSLSGKTKLIGTLAQIRYLPTGFVTTAEVLQLRSEDCVGQEDRVIAISRTGRSSVAKASCI